LDSRKRSKNAGFQAEVLVDANEREILWKLEAVSLEIRFFLQLGPLEY
jgi:hypothetical protein